MKTFKLELNENKINLILMALGELPAKHSMDLILDIQKQCQLQEKGEK